jgi:hypothetical protein
MAQAQQYVDRQGNVWVLGPDGQYTSKTATTPGGAGGSGGGTGYAPPPPPPAPTAPAAPEIPQTITVMRADPAAPWRQIPVQVPNPAYQGPRNVSQNGALSGALGRATAPQQPQGGGATTYGPDGKPVYTGGGVPYAANGTAAAPGGYSSAIGGYQSPVSPVASGAPPTSPAGIASYDQTWQGGGFFNLPGASTSDAAKNETWQDVADPLGILHGNAARVQQRVNELNSKLNRTREEQSELAYLQAAWQQALVTQREGRIADYTNEQGQAANARDALSYGARQGATQSYVDRTQDLANRFGSAADEANALRTGAQDQFNQQTGELNASDKAALQELRDKYGMYSQLDPNVGFNDVTSDAGLVGQQQGILDQMRGIGGGALDFSSQGAKAKADQRAVDSQYSALDQLGALTKPQETAAEKFLREQARDKQFRQEKANRDAVMHGMQARGLSGSGQLLAQTRAASAQNSQNRLLSDLGANAQATQRAMAALQGYGSLASTARDSSFGEALKAGVAADDVSNKNAQNRIVGTNYAGQQAGQMRESDDALKQFNASERSVIDRYNATYRADQQREAAERDMGLNTATRNTNAGVGERNKQQLDSTKDTAGQNLDTTGRNLRSQAGVANDALSAWQDLYANYDKNTDRTYGRTQDVVGAERGVTQDLLGVGNKGYETVDKALERTSGDLNAQIAAALASKNEGFLSGIFK